MTTFLSLPQEVIEHALVKLDIRDITCVAQSCRQLRSIVYLNNSLWRALFLHTFDDPRLASTYLSSAFLFTRPSGASPRHSSLHRCKATRGSDLRVGYDWLAEFQRRTISRSVLLSSEHGTPGGKRVPVCERVKALLTIVDIVLSAVSIPPSQLPISKDLAWVEEVLSVMDDKADGYKLYLPSHVGGAGTDAASLGLAAATDHVTWAWPSEVGPGEDEGEHQASSGATTPCSLVTISELSANVLVNRRSGAEYSGGHNTSPEEGHDGDEDFVEQERVLRARLRLLRGYSNSEKALIDSTITASGSRGSNKHEPQDLRLYARSRVYDLRRYKASNSWGPLIPSLLLSRSPSLPSLSEPSSLFPAPAGRSSHPAPHVFPPIPPQSQPQDFSSAGPQVRVDWEQVEAVLIDTSMNIYDHIDHDPTNCPRIMNPYGLDNSRAYSAPGCESHTMEYAPDGDWAGINGRWNRLISFCDYRDLRTYNDLLNSPWSPRVPNSLLSDPQFSEAVHVLSVDLQVTKVHPLSTCLPDFPNRPTLSIEGDTTYNGSDMSKLIGTVRMMPEGAIRWDFRVAMEGQDRWSSVGIQVGEAGSANGVMGIWTGSNHDPQDPAGPFWFWKVD